MLEAEKPGVGWGNVPKQRPPALCFSVLSASFLEIELPTDIKKNLSQSAQKPQGGQRGSPSGREPAPDVFAGDQIGLNAPFKQGRKIPRHEVFHALDQE